MKKLMMALAFVGLCAAANAQCDEFATPTTMVKLVCSGRC